MRDAANRRPGCRRGGATGHPRSSARTRRRRPVRRSAARSSASTTCRESSKDCSTTLPKGALALHHALDSLTELRHADPERAGQLVVPLGLRAARRRPASSAKYTSRYRRVRLVVRVARRRDPARAPRGGTTTNDSTASATVGWTPAPTAARIAAPGGRGLHALRNADGQPGDVGLDLAPQRPLRAAADDREAADVEPGGLHRLEDVAERERAPLEDRSRHVIARVRERQPVEDAARRAVPLGRHRPLHAGRNTTPVAARRATFDASSLSRS